MGQPLHAVQELGQSLWYDNISRKLIDSGELQALIDAGITGVTSNPVIFEKAIAGTEDYDPATRALVAEAKYDAEAIFERLAIEDIQRAAELLDPVYEATQGRDGYVSFEVSPHLANDTQGTIDAARRLWKTIGRRNAMIKVPATPAGIPAIRTLISEGININVTLLFAISAYEAAALAYLEGLEAFAASGKYLGRVASVASFFVSRIDTAVDAALETDPSTQSNIQSLEGKIAITNAQLAYAWYQELLRSERWQALERQGAQPQRLLWASTGTKNPEYSATLYVDTLIAPNTVNTVPAKTLDAFRESGTAVSMIDEEWDARVERAEGRLIELDESGISLDAITAKLLEDGVQQFADAFDQLLGAVESKRQNLLDTPLPRQTFSIDAETVSEALERWQRDGNIRRLWAGDASLWTQGDEDQWLGWLNAIEDARSEASEWQAAAANFQSAGFTDIALLGMGGSSLCPEVLQHSFSETKQTLQLHVLDSTVPEHVQAIEQSIELSNTLFIVSSKSGGTAETAALRDYFFDRLSKELDPGRAAAHFIAITDPGSGLEALARKQGWGTIIFGTPSIGGRFSALSCFGMLPAALIGVPMQDFLERAQQMVFACSACVPPEQNPGVQLGLTLAALAKLGRDKVTLVAPPRLASLGGWIEQLVAESTGKQGHGILPVDEEELGTPALYGDDRVFVQLRLGSEPDAKQESRVDALASAGHPVIRIELEGPLDLGAEFFRWEIATAVAGAEFALNPFDQPDVESTKEATRGLLTAYRESGRLPTREPLFEQEGFRLFGDADQFAKLCGSSGEPSDLGQILACFLAQIEPGDYFALQAYLSRSPETHGPLQELRHAIRDAKRVATTLGYGPRYLHSTGQLHKGGPNRGVFLQLLGTSGFELPVPGQSIDFGTLLRAQAQGDFEVLAERGRRCLGLELPENAPAALERLSALVKAALR